MIKDDTDINLRKDAALSVQLLNTLSGCPYIDLQIKTNMIVMLFLINLCPIVNC